MNEVIRGQTSNNDKTVAGTEHTNAGIEHDTLHAPRTEIDDIQHRSGGISGSGTPFDENA